MSDTSQPGYLPGTAVGAARFGRVLTIRLGPGEDVLPTMERILDDEGVQHGVILSGVASLHHASVRNIHRFPDVWPITADDRHTTTVPGPLEILAMQGNVARRVDGSLVVHCHLEFSAGSPPATTYGGHLVEDTIVGTTCELYIAELDGLLVRRVPDEVTRADELAIEPPTVAGG